MKALRSPTLLRFHDRLSSSEGDLDGGLKTQGTDEGASIRKPSPSHVPRQKALRVLQDEHKDCTPDSGPDLSQFPSKNRDSRARKLERQRTKNQPPRIDSFPDFLTHHARVKSGLGLRALSLRRARGAAADRRAARRRFWPRARRMPRSRICGGAQFGKTVLMLNLLAYLVAVRFRNVGYYLPDDDLVSGLVDGKLRPDVLDQIPWLARLIAVGKTLTPRAAR